MSTTATSLWLKYNSSCITKLSYFIRYYELNTLPLAASLAFSTVLILYCKFKHIKL